MKEVRLSPRIASGDLQRKFTFIEEKLRSGELVKITLRFKGREVTHADLGLKVVESIIQSAKPFASPSSPPRLNGRTIEVVLQPRKQIAS